MAPLNQLLCYSTLHVVITTERIIIIIIIIIIITVLTVKFYPSVFILCIIVYFVCYVFLKLF